MPSKTEYVHTLNTVVQRYRYTGEFIDSHHGPQHSGYWSSVVYINNMEYGNATGRTRKEARESAAREALLVLRHYA
ncbi:hypothetical protein BT96DRAFT_920761 [Gymnopus androsaceus JB14]|uniref:DRBM domain-containing protein n=1 Tax=Gymnopus androsaceus JB14 TaxID=1447944 RepID=A0A6A4HIC9_9AGAR|nr:hypothetical protein BT96DRAFT_920761 [Gymnopus androsaceus JB14]